MVLWRPYNAEQKEPPEVLYRKKVFLKIYQNSQENTCAEVSSLIKLKAWGNFMKKDTLAQVLSCECWEIFKNTFLTEHLRTASSWVLGNVTMNLGLP